MPCWLSQVATCATLRSCVRPDNISSPMTASAAVQILVCISTRFISYDLGAAGVPAMTITITAFERSPNGGKGLARDTRVRWALEEVGQPYEVRLLSFAAMKEPEHLALHPFGQIPTYEEDGLGLFETGAILFHIA